MRMTSMFLVTLFLPASWAVGQSSSLFLAAQARQGEAQAVTTQPGPNGIVGANVGTVTPQAPLRNQALVNFSFTAIELPEPRVYRVNDLISVIVRHRFRSQVDARMQQESEWDLTAKLDAWFRIHEGKLQQQLFRGGKPEVNFETENELENIGRSNRQDVLETRLKAKIIDIKPNGNLVIVAAKQIGNGEDVQVIMLSGECHKDDIQPDGSITSDQIHDLVVDTSNRGAIADVTKRGWLKELLDVSKAF